MKKTTLLLAMLLSVLFVKAQSTAVSNLDINTMSVPINAGGDLFWNVVSKQEMEVPKGSKAATIFAGNLWIGGFDQGAQLHLAAGTYRQNGVDFFQGPIMNPSSYSAIQDSKWDRLWKINKSTIDSFKLGLFTTIPSVISSWPGNGDTTLGQAHILAPFYDADHNGIYNPAKGDYPIIRGDQEVFFIYNDDRNIHKESAGTKLGVEFHGEAYAFNCPDSIFGQTMFLHYDIINRSQNTYVNTRLGAWTDFDIGYYNDDFIGCDSSLNSFYGYNGKAIDGTGATGSYGAHPPAQGVTCLNMPMSGFMYYNNDFSTTGNPKTDLNYYGYMKSTWPDNTTLTIGGTGKGGNTSGNYAYESDSEIPWTEEGSGDTPGDRRGIGSFGNFTFKPGATQSLDLAYVFARNVSASATNLSNVNILKQDIKIVQNAFNTNMTTCGSRFTTAVNEVKGEETTLSIYPNPAKDQLIINVNGLAKNSSFQIYDITGRMVKGFNSEDQARIRTLNIADLANGLYILRVTNGDQMTSKKFIKH